MPAHTSLMQASRMRETTIRLRWVEFVGLLLYLLAATVSSSRTCHAQRTEQRDKERAPELQRLASVSLALRSSSGDGFGLVSGAARLASGRFAVLDATTQEIALFDSTGRYERALSRRGRGPGELENGRWLGSAGDSIFVHDVPSRALTSFVVNGKPVRHPQASSAIDADAMQVLARLADGALAVTPHAFRANRARDGELAHDSIRVGIRAAGTSARVQWLGYFPSQTWVGYRHPESGAHLITRSRVHGVLQIAGSGDRLWIVPQGAETLLLFDGRGRLRTGIALPWSTARITPAAVREAHDRLARDATSALERARISASMIPPRLPAFFPIIERLIAIADGGVAVERFRPTDESEREYLVLSSQGEVTARFRLPADTRLMSIAWPYLMAARTDADGLEVVRVFRWSR